MNKSPEKIPLLKIGKLIKRDIIIWPNEYYKTVGCKLYGQGVYERETKLGANISSSKMFLIKENDLLINRIWAQKGSIGIVPKDLDNSVVTNDFPVVLLDTNEINPSYLSWYIKNSELWEECRKHSYGTSGRERLKTNEILNIEIPLPPLEEQKRIVEKIDFIVNKVEDVRALREEAIKEAERLRTSSIDRIFQNFPLEFTNKKLYEIADISSGGTPSRSNHLFFNGSIKWVQLSDITKIKKYIMDTKEYLSEEGLKNSSAKLYSPSTVLISMYQKIGEVAITKDYMATNQAIAGISSLDGINEEYLYYFLLSMKGKWIGKGTAQENINQKILENVEVSIPPLPVQEKIVSYLDSLKDKIDELKKLQTESEKEIEQLIPSILDKAFKGEL